MGLSCRPSGAKRGFAAPSLGLPPQAIPCRRSAAKNVRTCVKSFGLLTVPQPLNAVPTFLLLPDMNRNNTCAPSPAHARESRGRLAKPLQFLHFFRRRLLSEKFAAQFREAHGALLSLIAFGRQVVAFGRQLLKGEERPPIGIAHH